MPYQKGHPIFLYYNTKKACLEVGFVDNLVKLKIMKLKNFFSKINKKICQLFDDLQGMKVSPLVFLLSFLTMVGLRTFIDFFLASDKNEPVGAFIEYLHNLFFFFFLSILTWFLLGFILKTSLKKLTPLILISFWFFLLTPIFDIIQTKGYVYWSFYALVDFQDILKHFFTFFGELPSGIKYFGAKITSASGIIFVGLAVFLKTKSFFKAIFGAFFAYIIIFIIGIFPSFLTFIYYFFEGSKNLVEIKDFHAIQLFSGANKIFGLEFNDFKYSFGHNLNVIYFTLSSFLMGFLFFWLDKAKFMAFWKNWRFPQLFCHFGLFFIGLGVGVLYYPENFNLNIISFFALSTLLLSIFLAWEASVVFNDLGDFEVDAISNKWRPLPSKIFSVQEYREFGIVLTILSLLGGLVVGIKFAIILAIYQIIACFYSEKPFRLKKIPFLATFLSSFALVLVFFMGFILFSGDENLLKIPWRIVFLFILTFTFSLALKDFKDIEGDRSQKVWTLPVIFGEKIAKVVIASGIFISFMLSVFLLNEFRLFWWAILFGSLAFLAVIFGETKNTKIFWWILEIVFVYGLILVKIIFF